jgi:4-amino-4-deoxy-L-arabinose transferase-like glycosyltransferase
MGPNQLGQGVGPVAPLSTDSIEQLNSQVVTDGTENLGPFGNYSSDPLWSVGSALSTRSFRIWLTGIVSFATAFRVGYVLIFTRFQNQRIYDALWYQLTAEQFRLGQFFRVPESTPPTAAHPPMTSLLLGLVNLVIPFGKGTTIPRLTEAVLGGLVVLFVGIVGRDIAGPKVGLVAAGLAALAPDFWMPSGIVMSETPAMLIMALILLSIVRYIRSPGLTRAALIGLACAAETLVRAELVLFVPALLLPTILGLRTEPLRRRMGQLGCALLMFGVLLAPWVARNLVSFTDATYVSTGNGLALLGANCNQTYYGSQLGSWSFACATSKPGSGDESVQSERDEQSAVRYARGHLSRLPVVMLARIGREWGFYRPAEDANIELGEGRPAPATDAGTIFYYFMLGLGIAGVVLFRRRHIRQWFLLVPAGVLTFVSALVYGLVRFRAPFEVCLAILAAGAVVRVAERLNRHRVSNEELH